MFSRAFLGSAAIACLSLCGVQASAIRVLDITPQTDSSEQGQNSEPSLTINPVNNNQMIAGAFSSTGLQDGSVASPYYFSTDHGKTWQDYGSLGTLDKSLTWLSDGSAALTASIPGALGVQVRSGTIAGGSFSTLINNNTDPNLDQPWIVAGKGSNVYLSYNKFDTPTGFNTATVAVSTDGGNTFTEHYIDPLPPVVQDAPSVRTASSGDTVYAVYSRWNSVIPVNGGNDGFLFPGSQVMIVKSTDGGANFTALNGVNGVQIALTTQDFSQPPGNTQISVGRERVGGDIAIAVDPRNANHLVVAYQSIPALGQIQLVLAESKDGGATWTNKYATPLVTRAGQPAVAITQNGAISLMYDDYVANVRGQPAGRLETHLITSYNDFKTSVVDTLLASSINRFGGQPGPNGPPGFDPYLGDFINLYGIGNTLYGIFSANALADCTHAYFPGGVDYLRDTTGFTQGSICSSTFALTDSAGDAFDPSGQIDPFFFQSQVPEPASLLLLGAGLLGAARLRQARRKKANA